MLNRRHIRLKVMQSLYAFLHSKSEDLTKEEKFLRFSIDQMQVLYVLQLQLLLEVQQRAQKHIDISKKKLLATQADIFPNTNFVDNSVLLKIKESPSFTAFKKLHKIDNWDFDNEYSLLLWNALQAADFYKIYIEKKTPSFDDDKAFIINYFTEIIAPNDKLMDYYEDKNIFWLDDIPFINTWIVKDLNKIKQAKQFKLGKLYKDEDDFKFVSDLFQKTLLNHKEFEAEIVKNTPNWDVDRIADIDMILIKMAICEFIHFHSIPVKVSMNEYIEISKDYSTKKSSYFINGVLDKVSKELTANKKIKKMGRGLL